MPPIRKFSIRSLDMKLNPLISAVILASCPLAYAERHHDGWKGEPEKPLTFTADMIAVDNVTKAAVATGHVHAVRDQITLRGERLERDADGIVRFNNPTCVTTCTNEVGHTHWNVTGEVVYKDDEYVIVRDALVRFWEIPVLYMPYFYYPLNWSGIQWMPGYMGRWGGFILTKTSYDILGDSKRSKDNEWWLRGETNVDLRFKQGLALGEGLFWNAGDFGHGNFSVYYAWDNDAEKRYGGAQTDRNANWGSLVESKRYGLTGYHRWQITERDSAFVRGVYYSDSFFCEDFMRRSFFDIRSQWMSFPSSGVFWEHLENAFSIGAEFDGRLNDFFGMTQRLPEFYVDINPTPIGNLPFNYESQNHLGWLDRRYAEYAGAKISPYGVNPGLWGDYATVRFDTYHRLTMPFKTAGELLSVVPRIGFHGTYWNNSGVTDLVGDHNAVEARSMFRSIIEGGVTFSSRANGWVDSEWSHMIEPYLDLLCQHAFYTGDSESNRPYVFDAIDASLGWDDQFAGRGRNLPYSYYGITPGLRNAWSLLNESGELQQLVDFDVYAAVMFGSTSFDGDANMAEYDQHKLAKLGKPNYGTHDINVMPGARLRWRPSEDISLSARAEYDADNSKLAIAAFTYNQRVTDKFNYNLTYALHNYRYWDFSSSPTSAEFPAGDINLVKSQYLYAGCEYRPLDWLVVGPFIRYDCNASELDSIGGWVDLLTDCLGFRVLLEYNKEYFRIDGYRQDDDFSIGFYIYFRAFGEGSTGIFSTN